MVPRLPLLILPALLLAAWNTGAQSLRLMHWNVAGNGTTDWSTNAPQVRAIGRVVQHVNPDVVAFNEIPRSSMSQLTNWVTAFLPGYFLANNSGTDGFLMSAVLSRHPVTRSQSWMDGVTLAPFGYTNSPSTYTRDLFEAEIVVPGWTQPLHVFTTHLKATDGSSGTTFTNSVNRRAAEASAVSNFFVNVFLPTNGGRPYVLMGDLNEDIGRPLSHTGRAIQRLLAPSTGLRLNTPRNPVNGSTNTYSIRGTLNSRLDYILPGGLLFSNLATSQIFRSDVLNPLPPGMLPTDSSTASDHLPVLATFLNPYELIPKLGIGTSINPFLNLNWSSVSGRTYRVEASTNWLNWTAAGPDVVAESTNATLSVPGLSMLQVFRIRRMP